MAEALEIIGRPPASAPVAFADDEKHILRDVGDLLRSAGFQVLSAETAKDTLHSVETKEPDLVVLDLRFPDCTDLSLLRRIKQVSPNIEVIMLTSEDSDIEIIVSAIKLGAYDYVTKPFAPDELLNRIQKALELKVLRRSQHNLLNELKARDGLQRLVGESESMRFAKETIRRLAEVDGCVLIRGGSGTGKELAARALHYHSRRRGSPFVTVNCAAIPETLLSSELFGHRRGAFTGAIESTKGKFELAEDGTIFLDEIGDMPLTQQTILLRVLENRTYFPVGDTKERECSARFIFATNRELRERVSEGLFREDLFYRINVASLTMPALKSRPDDIPSLVEFFNRRLSIDMGRRPLEINPDVIALFQQYDWPGNVRELKHVLEGAMMLLSPEQKDLRVNNLPMEIIALTDEGMDPERQRQHLERVLRQCNGNQTEAAKLMGVHRNTIRMRIRQFGIQANE